VRWGAGGAAESSAAGAVGAAGAQPATTTANTNRSVIQLDRIDFWCIDNSPLDKPELNQEQTSFCSSFLP
jgi:hypothetical protein